MGTVICWDAGRAAQLKQMSYLEVAATIGACSGAHRRETRPIAKEAGMVRGLKLKLFAALLWGRRGHATWKTGPARLNGV